MAKRGLSLWLVGVLFTLCVVSAGAQDGHILRSTHSKHGAAETVAARLCYGGRFKIESQTERAGSRQLTASTLEQVASSPDHENAHPLGDAVTIVSDVDLEVGKIYALIITDGSKLGKTIVAWAEDMPEAFAEVKRIMESPEAYQNSPRWAKRRQLWRDFGRDVGFKERITVYCENDELNQILYAVEKDGRPSLYLYDAASKDGHPMIHAKMIPGVNRITYEDGEFLVWYFGQVELYIR
jgi:hypothetical protein